jgi:hypothetical protein
LCVTLHLCELPSGCVPAAGLFLRVHAVDVGTGNELHINQEQTVPSRSSGLVSKISGKMALVETTLTFEAPLQLALENDVILLFEIFVPRSTHGYSSCYARMSVGEFI